MLAPPPIPSSQSRTTHFCLTDHNYPATTKIMDNQDRSGDVRFTITSYCSISLMCVAMYHWLPKASFTPPLRSPYGWSVGSEIDVAPAARARWYNVSQSGT